MTGLHTTDHKQAGRRSGKNISRAEFEALRTRLEEVEDALEVLHAQNAGPSDDAWPQSLVDRLLAGETPLKLWREFRGLTLEALGRKTGIAKGYLSEIESGKKPGSAASLKKCARALEVDLDDLVRG